MRGDAVGRTALGSALIPSRLGKSIGAPIQQSESGAGSRAASLRRGDQRNRLTTIFVVSLAFPILPLELGLGKVPLSTLSTAVAIFLAVRYANSESRRMEKLEIVLVAFATWATLRLLVLGPLDGQPPEIEIAIREIGATIGAIGVYRLSQQQHLRPAINRGIAIAFVALVVLELYQEIAGLARLKSVGYISANGFNYYTVSGNFRPFGLFTGPTTFGTFLAMLGVYLALTATRPRQAVTYWAVTLLSVLATSTRAALLGVIFAAFAALMMSPRIKRSAAVWIFGPLSIALVVIVRPDYFTAAFQRLISATDTADSSRVTRLGLWRGVVDATSNAGDALVGLGNADWIATMSPQVGDVVIRLGHAHSNFFQAWYRYGAVGALIFTILIATALGSCIIRARRKNRFALGSLGAIIVFATDSVFNNSLSSVNFVLMLFLMLGMSHTTSDRVSNNFGSRKWAPASATYKCTHGSSGLTPN